MLIHCFNFCAALFFRESRTWHQLISSAALKKNCQNLKLVILVFEFSLIVPQNNLHSTTYSTNMLKSNQEVQNQDWIKLKMKVSSTYVHRLFKWIYICWLRETKQIIDMVEAHLTGHPCKISLYSFLCWKYWLDLRLDNWNPKLLISFTESTVRFKLSFKYL